MMDKKEFVKRIEELLAMIDIPYESNADGTAKNIKEAVEYARTITEDEGDVIIAAGLVGLVALALSWGYIHVLDTAMHPLKLLIVGDKQEKRVRSYLDTERRSN